MKKALTFILLISSLFTYAQTVTYQDIQAQRSARDLTGRKGGGDITEYVASDGVT